MQEDFQHVSIVQKRFKSAKSTAMIDLKLLLGNAICPGKPAALAGSCVKHPAGPPNCKIQGCVTWTWHTLIN